MTILGGHDSRQATMVLEQQLIPSILIGKQQTEIVDWKWHKILKSRIPFLVTQLLQQENTP